MNSSTIYNVILCTSLLLAMSGSGSPVTIGDILSYFHVCLTKTVNQNQLNDSAYLRNFALGYICCMVHTGV